MRIESKCPLCCNPMILNDEQPAGNWVLCMFCAGILVVDRPGSVRTVNALEKAKLREYSPDADLRVWQERVASKLIG